MTVRISTSTPSARRRTSAASATSPAARRSARTQDALALLRADHRHVGDLFAQLEKARAATRKRSLVAEICKELKIHTQIEEEIFYPAAKAALRDKELVPEALVEHASLRALISQVEGREPDGEMYDAKLQVLSEYVKHHVKEEQNELFPKLKASRLDLDELGQRLAARKAQLKTAQ